MLQSNYVKNYIHVHSQVFHILVVLLRVAYSHEFGTRHVFSCSVSSSLTPNEKADIPDSAGLRQQDYQKTSRNISRMKDGVCAPKPGSKIISTSVLHELLQRGLFQ